MIWGYRFDEIQAHLARLGYREVRRSRGTVVFLNGRQVFTIREPNVAGLLPEPIVQDAFDAARLPPPPPATRYVD